MSITETYQAVLSTVFGPLLALPPAIGEGLMAAMITLIISFFYKYMVNQVSLRELKVQMKTLQAKANEQQKNNPDDAKKTISEVMKLSNKQMMMNFKPMFPTMLLALLLLPWMASVWTGPIVILPFNLPYFGSDFGWLMWYMLLSMPLSQLFRKTLGVE